MAGHVLVVVDVFGGAVDPGDGDGKGGEEEEDEEDGGADEELAAD